jgi:predicted amidohydrolase
MVYDFLIKGGGVIDPKQEIHGIRDEVITHGKIAAHRSLTYTVLFK